MFKPGDKLRCIKTDCSKGILLEVGDFVEVIEESNEFVTRTKTKDGEEFLIANACFELVASEPQYLTVEAIDAMRDDIDKQAQDLERRRDALLQARRLVLQGYKILPPDDLENAVCVAERQMGVRK